MLHGNTHNCRCMILPKKVKKTKHLHINLKGEYFDEIKNGTKEWEYRLYNKYWKKRLLNDDGTHKVYEDIIIQRGYPKADDITRRIVRPWRGFKITKVSHKRFGPDQVKVFAIKVN